MRNMCSERNACGIHLIRFFDNCIGETTFVIFCLLCSILSPFSEKGPHLKGKQMVQRGANAFLLEETPFQKSGKTTLTELPP